MPTPAKLSMTGSGNDFDALGWIPEAIGQETAGVEVKSLPGAGRDFGVFVLDGGTELSRSRVTVVAIVNSLQGRRVRPEEEPTHSA